VRRRTLAIAAITAASVVLTGFGLDSLNLDGKVADAILDNVGRKY
jgi:hypothetical protein